MKIALNLKPTDNPFGGGNSFLKLLIRNLEESGVEFRFDLYERDLDFILILDPRWKHPLRQFSLRQIFNYSLRNPKTLIVHRINECDERKNTKNMNNKIQKANYLADATVFVSSWLSQLDLSYMKSKAGIEIPTKIILNGSDEKLFKFDNSRDWDGREKIKIITHHWSSNAMKGLAVYQALDDLLDDRNCSSLFSFTYLGNVPKGAKFKNTTVLPPLSGRALAEELSKHHVYLTGSLNEPGGNHQNEGGLSGLPIIFLKSGSMSEYCDGYGVGLDSIQDLKGALGEVRDNYASLRQKMINFPHTSSRMTSEYASLFDSLLSSIPAIIQRRNRFRDPRTLLRLQFPM